LYLDTENTNEVRDNVLFTVKSTSQQRAPRAPPSTAAELLSAAG
jgi:hypothetical protein